MVVDVDPILPGTDLPMLLADVHRSVEVGTSIELLVPTPSDGPWDRPHLARVVEAGGFEVDGIEPSAGTATVVRGRSLRALPDHVGADMALLCCGLNPSLHAADAGVGYVTGSNRFWRALAAAGISTSDRDPGLLLRRDRVGMTDLVKRPTARADELSTAEHRAGLDRLDELCEWLRPDAVAVVGLAGWRAAVDRRTTVGWQERRLGPSPVYVLPSTSGLNAGTSLDALAAHLRAASAGPPD